MYKDHRNSLTSLPTKVKFSGLLSPSWHSHQFDFCLSIFCTSTFLRSLCSMPITALHRYYGRSDSCPFGSSALPCMNTLSSNRQVSLIHASGLPIPLSPPTCQSSDVAFTRYPSARRIFRFRRSRLHLSLVGSPILTGRIEFVILRVDRSPPVALHPASRRRSYNRLQAGERLPGEDFHLSVQTRFQAHLGRTAGSLWARQRSASTNWEPMHIFMLGGEHRKCS